MKKNKTRRKKSQRKTTKSYKKHLILASFVAAIAIFGVSILAYKSTVDYSKLDASEKNLEMIKLPPEIKKKVENATPSATFAIPILMYHYVEYVQDKRDKTRQSLDIIPSTFQQQLETLKNANFTFLTMADLADIMNGKKTPPPNPIVITIDDGYRDLYTDVFPIIKKENVKVTSYVIADFLDKPNFLLTPQLLELANSGLVEIGAHTLHHIYLKGASEGAATNEIVLSKIQLENLIHKPVISFAYPYGAFDQQAADIVKNAGFETAVSTVPGKEESDVNRFFIYRIRPGARVGDELVHFLQQTTFKPW